MENELEKMENFLKEFNEKFGNIDVTQLTGDVKKEFLKAKKIVDQVQFQKDMANNVLDTLGEFGVSAFKIGNKTFSKTEEPIPSNSEVSVSTPTSVETPSEPTTDYSSQFEDLK